MQGVEKASELSSSASIWIALAITAALVGVHLLAPAMRRLNSVSERATASFAGGAAVTYFFLHLLPELAEGNERVGEVLGDPVDATPLLELAIFAVALAGFTVFYGLDRLAHRHASGDMGAQVFRLHLSSYFVFNALITYTMPLRLRAGVGFAIAFSVAIGLHFILTDRAFEDHHRTRFEMRGRFVLAGGLLAGWALAALMAPASTVFVALLVALLGGAVLLNVFKEELPAAGRGSSYPWFLAGVVSYAVVLVIVTALSD